MAVTADVSQLILDREKLAAICEDYLSGRNRRSLFIFRAEEVAEKYDQQVASTLLHQVEHTVHEHVCHFWSDCAIYCRYENCPDCWEDQVGGTENLFIIQESDQVM